MGKPIYHINLKKIQYLNQPLKMKFVSYLAVNKSVDVLLHDPVCGLHFLVDFSVHQPLYQLHVVNHSCKKAHNQTYLNTQESHGITHLVELVSGFPSRTTSASWTRLACRWRW